MAHTTDPSKRANVHLLWFGDAVAAACDQLLFVGIPIFALTSLGLGAHWLGFALAMQHLPSLLLAQVLAGAIDRRDRRLFLMLGSVFCAFGALALAALAYLRLENATGWAVLVLCFVLGIGNAMYQIAAAAVGPTIEADRPVTDVLTGQASVRTAWRMAGLAAAGPALDWLGGVAVLSVVACAFALRGVTSLRLAIQAPQEQALQAGLSQAPALTAAGVAPVPTIPDTINPWRLVWTTPTLRDGIAGLFLLNVGGGLVSGAYFAYAHDLLKLSSTMIGGLMLLGTLSALVALRWAKGAVKRHEPAFLCGAAGFAAALVGWILPFMPLGLGWVGLAAYHVIFGAVSVVVVVAFTIMRQKAVPNQFLGRVASVSATTNAAAIAGGAALSSLLLPWLKTQPTLIAGAALASLSCVFWRLLAGRKSMRG
jgi:Major Facilitator Superfamily